MRNVFDQYSQPENQLTHALVCSLHHDRSVLLKPFLEWLGAKNIPDIKTIKIVEQQLPGSIISGEEISSEAQKGLPDASIYTNDGWALLIESKVQAKLTNDQLVRHFSTARNHDFQDPQLVAIVVDRNETKKIKNTTIIEWRELYSWFRTKRKKSSWASYFSEYLESFESKKLANNYNIRGTLTMFDGFHFDDDNPFQYGEAKRLLRLLGEELRQYEQLDALGVDLYSPGRGMITGSQGGVVWDYLRFKGAPGDGRSKWPHLTYAVKPNGLGAMLNFPNHLSGGLKSLFSTIGQDQLHLVFKQVEKQLRPIIRRVKGSAPFFEVIQRHYPSRTAQPIVDGHINADLRTLSDGKSAVKSQPEWLESGYQLIANKRSNLQFGISMRFPYESKIVQSPGIAKEFVNAWVAMKPLIDVGLEHVRQR